VTTASYVLRTAAAVTLLVATAARPVSADRGPLPWDCVANGTCCFVQKPTAARFQPPVIDVGVDRLSVGDTGLERSQVRRALRRQAMSLESCFHRDDGSVEVVLVIGPSGAARATEATGTSKRIEGCISRALARVVFPIAEDHAVTEARVTITGVRR